MRQQDDYSRAVFGDESQYRRPGVFERFELDLPANELLLLEVVNK